MAVRKRLEELAPTLLVYLEVTSALLIAAAIYYFVSNHGLGSFLFYLTVFLPAMTANGSAVLAPRVKAFVSGGKAGLHPIDGGLVWRGKRLLGDGKTWEGLLIGALAGILVAVVLSVIYYLEYSAKIAMVLFGSGVYSSIAALVGDIVGSFVKRRLGLERGAPAPLMDQADFYVFASIAVYLAGVELSLEPLVWFFFIVYGMHVLTNCIAYRMGLKRECP
ncbi:MAG: CDP-2,3-bis-(O-geranylgeranyl)-sn-glycerol synthase [Desulfurococcales archaeon]|nr:CDP-2,3-bis-(O-geranylgeranyl)-sn-glycerol synthase [Desulfurococcales archaeon]